jgi:hypothetical protein
VRPLLALLAASLLVAGPAEAAKKKSAAPASKGAKRYGVLASGPSATASIKAAVTALKAVQVPDNRLQEEAQKYGIPLGTDSAYQALAVGMKLNAVLRISTFDRTDGALAVVQVRDGATGAVVDDASWKAANTKLLGQMLTRQLKSRFSRSLAGTRAPPAGFVPAPPPGTALAAPAGVAAVAQSAPATTASKSPASSSPGQSSPPLPTAAPTSGEPALPTGAAPPLPSSTGASPSQADLGIVGSTDTRESRGPREGDRPDLDLALGAAVLHRSFTYKDDLYQELQGYSLSAAAQPAAELTWMPLFGGHLGVTGHVAASIGLQSKASDGTSYPTQALAWGAGLRWRFFLGEQSELGIGVRYEHQGFTTSGTASSPKPDLPDVKYSAVAGGLDLRLSLFGPVSFLAGGGYRYLLSVGEIGSAAWFPHQSSQGVDAMVGFGVALGRAFEIRIQGQFQRYGFSFNPEPGDPRVAGGATDTYLSGGLSLAWRN